MCDPCICANSTSTLLEFPRVCKFLLLAALENCSPLLGNISIMQHDSFCNFVCPLTNHSCFYCQKSIQSGIYLIAFRRFFPHFSCVRHLHLHHFLVVVLCTVEQPSLCLCPRWLAGNVFLAFVGEKWVKKWLT